VLVTHDPEEAALLADEILVVADGRLLQAGPRAEVYNRPASPQVARLLGIQNLGHGVVSEPGAITVGALRIAADTGDLPAGCDVLWTIRPDHVAVGARGAYPAIVDDVADIGTITTINVRLPGGPELRVRTTDPGELGPGDTCRVDLDPAAVILWPSGLSARDPSRLES
jgi:molybdate transport system permease protein